MISKEKVHGAPLPPDSLEFLKFFHVSTSSKGLPKQAAYCHYSFLDALVVGVGGDIIDDDMDDTCGQLDGSSDQLSLRGWRLRSDTGADMELPKPGAMIRVCHGYSSV